MPGPPIKTVTEAERAQLDVIEDRIAHLEGELVAARLERAKAVRVAGLTAVARELGLARQALCATAPAGS